MEMRYLELSRRLRAARASIVCARRNAVGETVHLVRLASGEMYPMFHADAVAFATGSSTLQEIVARNQGADLAGPWPAPGGLSAPNRKTPSMVGLEEAPAGESAAFGGIPPYSGQAAPCVPTVQTSDDVPVLTPIAADAMAQAHL
jgi:hypothetical protein